MATFHHRPGSLPDEGTHVPVVPNNTLVSHVWFRENGAIHLESRSRRELKDIAVFPLIGHGETRHERPVPFRVFARSWEQRSLVIDQPKNLRNVCMDSSPWHQRRQHLSSADRSTASPIGNPVLKFLVSYEHWKRQVDMFKRSMLTGKETSMSSGSAVSLQSCCSHYRRSGTWAKPRHPRR